MAGGGGAEVKNTGDGLLATFTSAVEALGAAVRMQPATDRQGRSAGVPPAVRVGLALGEVAVEDGDVFGTPVVEAARLVAAARPGQILAGALVRAVAGSRAGVPFTDLGSLDLKGLAEPLAVCEVGWVPLPGDGVPPAIPLPGLLLRTGRIFVGRDGELERLHRRWKEAAAGARSLVLLGGEPGVGKTRLAAALAAELHAEGAVVLAGRCDEDMGVPYQPFVEALRHSVANAGAGVRLGRHSGELARLILELPQLVPDLPEPLRSDPETERYRLFDAIAAWLADVSAETPVLLVLDDLHWAARPTLQLLRHILRSDDPMRLLVVATYRDTETAAGDPFGDFLADLPRIDGAVRLGVPGLDPAAVAAYVEAAAGHELDEQGAAMAETVWRETQGNCFFVAEVLRHLAESSGDSAHRETFFEAARLAKRKGDVDALVRSALGNTRAMYTTVIADSERLAVLEAAATATEGETTPRRAVVLAALGLELTYMDDWDKRAASSALTEGLGDPMAIAWAWWLRLRTALEVGAGPETAEALGRLEAIACDLGHPTLLWFTAVIRGTHALAVGRIREAALDAVAGHDFADVPFNPLWQMTMAWSAMAAAHLADSNRAATPYELLTPDAGQVAGGFGAFAGAFAHHLGSLATVLGRFEDAESHFVAADEIHRRAGVLPWLARSRLEWARMLVERRRPGDTEHARELLDQALTASVRLELGNVERRARSLLEAML